MSGQNKTGQECFSERCPFTLTICESAGVHLREPCFLPPPRWRTNRLAQLRERVDAAKSILRRCRDGINSADAMVDCDGSHTRPDSQWSVACGAGVNPGGATESQGDDCVAAAGQSGNGHIRSNLMNATIRVPPLTGSSLSILDVGCSTLGV